MTDLLIENSMALINETTASDLAGVETVITNLIKQRFKGSIADDVAEIAPLKTPTGTIFSLAIIPGTYDFQVLKTPVSVETYNINSGFTKEAMDDLYAIHGEYAPEYVGRIFSGMSSTPENNKILDVARTNSEVVPSLSALNSWNAEETVFNFSQKISQLILKKSEGDYYNSLKGWAILPQRVASSFMAHNWSNNRYVSDDAKFVPTEWFVGEYGNIKYYVSPDKDQEDVLVGSMGKTPGSSALYFSPYAYTVYSATDPDSGHKKYFLNSRFAVTVNPLHSISPMLHRFDITWS